MDVFSMDARKEPDLRVSVWHGCRRLVQEKLVILTEGNVSAVTESRMYMVIKPSGVPYGALEPDSLVCMRVSGGEVANPDGMRPSSDTPTHLEIYRNFPNISAIVHTHSPYATVFAQEGNPIPCLGTTHADAFDGDVPVTRLLSEEEVRGAYEQNIGASIVAVLRNRYSNAVLVNRHGPFSFGATVEEAVDHAVNLEKVAMLARLMRVRPEFPTSLREVHYFRKHGDTKYYGQGGGG